MGSESEGGAGVGRAGWFGLATVCLVGLLLRVGYQVELSAAPDYAHPAIDAGFHDDWARSIVFDDHVRPAHLADPEIETTPFLRPPGYPYFLAAVYAVTGGSYVAARVVHVLSGLGTVLLGWSIARRWFDRRLATVFSALLATHWSLVYFEGELHAETLLVLLELAFVRATVRAVEEESLPRAGFAGMLGGLAALFRPNALFFLPVAIGWIVWVLRRRSRPGAGRLSVALVLGATAAISPATVRNLSASGELVPITSNLGINLHLGNRAGATGTIDSDLGELGSFKTCYDYPGIVRNLERQLGRELDHGEVSSHFTGLALDWMRGSPGAFLALTARKALLFWGPREISHNKVVSVERRRSRVLRWLPAPFPVVLALALFGLGALRRSAGGESDAVGSREVCVLFGALAAAYFLSVLPFFVASRYRVPILPFVLLFAARGLVRVPDALRAPARHALPAGIAVVATVAIALLDPYGGEAGGEEARWHLDRGRAWFAAEELALAEAEFQTAIELAPDSPAAHYELAVTFHKRGDLPSARRAYRSVLQRDPGHPLALFNLADLLEGAGDPDRALARFAQAAEADPNLAPAHVRAAALYLARRSYVEAEPHLRAAVELLPGDPGRRDPLALLLATSPIDDQRDGAEAVRLAEANVAADSNPVFQRTLAAAYAEVGRFPEAIAAVERAISGFRSMGAEGAVQSLRSDLEAYRAGRPRRAPR